MRVGGLWDMNYLEGWAPVSLSYRLTIWEEKGGEPETTGDRDWINAGAMKFNLRYIRASSWRGDKGTYDGHYTTLFNDPLFNISFSIISNHTNLAVFFER
jgi:hypothetical protein